ncbi:hypothetical protein BC830DRAFT_1094670 [Chytriomyces sp. MP71]|nr:hypothetical protein BC830DRAFT_1094670 [Chytriomyces sp. MP71]
MLTLDVTHIIATHLTDRKITLWKNRRVVDPKWLHDSIAAGKLLPWNKYGLIQRSSAALFQPLLEPPSAPTASTAATSQNDAALALLSKSGVSNLTSRESTNFALKNSATSAGFLTKYYESSRLSKISNWKSDLKDYVLELKAETLKRHPPMSNPVSGARHKTIMHIDMDCFFASVAIRDRPDLKDKPVVVCHSKGTGYEDGIMDPTPGTSTSEIASCNYIARKYGIKNGMLLGKAQQLVQAYHTAHHASSPVPLHKHVTSVPYEFEKYDACSKTLYRILQEAGDDIMVVSCDEAYIDVSSRIAARGSGLEIQLAEDIRAQIFEATGCCASVGIGANMVTARVATKKAKPNGAFLIEPERAEEEFMVLGVGDLPGVGYVLKMQMEELGIKTCGDLVSFSMAECKKRFGEANGLKLYQFCRGVDTRSLENKPRQSVGAEVNWGVRFQTLQEAHTFLRELAGEVASRLDKSGMQGRHVTLKVKKKLYEGEPYKLLGCGPCQDLSKSKTLESAVSSVEAILQEVMPLFRDLGVAPGDLRGVGIHLSKLVNKSSSSLKGQTLLRFMTAASPTAKRVRDVVVEEEGEVQVQADPKEAPPVTAKRVRIVEPAPVRHAVEQAAVRHQVELPTASQIDWSILEHLPADIRAEVLSLRQQGGALQLSAQPAQPIPPPAVIEQLELPQIFAPKVPNIIGRTSYQDVIDLLREWVDCTNQPSVKDTSQIKKYLKALVENWEGERCLNVWKKLNMLVTERWSPNESIIWRRRLDSLKRDIGDNFLVTYGSLPSIL